MFLRLNALTPPCGCGHFAGNLWLFWLATGWR